MKCKIPEKEPSVQAKNTVVDKIDTINHTVRELCKIIARLEAENRSLQKQLERKDNNAI